MTEREVSSERVSALPPVDGLEVVGHLFRLEYGPDHWSQQLMYSEVLPKEGDYKEHIPLVTLSQASSIIAGLRKERDAAEKAQRHTAGKWAIAERMITRLKHEVESAGALRLRMEAHKASAQAAEARISSLEEENKRLREAASYWRLGNDLDPTHD